MSAVRQRDHRLGAHRRGDAVAEGQQPPGLPRRDWRRVERCGGCFDGRGVILTSGGRRRRLYPGDPGRTLRYATGRRHMARRALVGYVHLAVSTCRLRLMLWVFQLRAHGGLRELTVKMDELHMLTPAQVLYVDRASQRRLHRAHPARGARTVPLVASHSFGTIQNGLYMCILVVITADTSVASVRTSRGVQSQHNILPVHARTPHSM